MERFGRVDALACVAGGFAMAGPLHEAPVDVWRSQLAVNLDTAFTISRAALRPMLERAPGSIVFVGSRAALRPFPGAAAYIVSKAAVIALMQTIDAEVRGKGVRANVVVPNIVDTPRNRERTPTPTLPVDDRRRAGRGHRVALRRRVGAAVGRYDPRLWPRLAPAPPS